MQRRDEHDRRESWRFDDRYDRGSRRSDSPRETNDLPMNSGRGSRSPEFDQSSRMHQRSLEDPRYGRGRYDYQPWNEELGSWERFEHRGRRGDTRASRYEGRGLPVDRRGNELYGPDGHGRDDQFDGRRGAARYESYRDRFDDSRDDRGSQRDRSSYGERRDSSSGSSGPTWRTFEDWSSERYGDHRGQGIGWHRHNNFTNHYWSSSERSNERGDRWRDE